MIPLGHEKRTARWDNRASEHCEHCLGLSVRVRIKGNYKPGQGRKDRKTPKNKSGMIVICALQATVVVLSCAGQILVTCLRADSL